MKRLAILTLAGALLFGGCSSGAPADTGSSEQGMAADTTDQTLAAGYNFFPMSESCYIGDTMPFYDDGKMNIFYLADQRDGKTGYHPWALMTTENYCSFEDQGVVIPYGDTVDDQDIALGTGSVIKDKDGLYHAFYTGHNDIRSPKEAIMHATSSDKMTWTKIPEDTFVSNENYSLDDFRDPYVFWVEEEQCYWMLIVTRYERNGVIVKYTSKDLSTWEDGGVIFTDDMGYGANLECPTILKYGDLWYLSFSDQWPYKLVHYRVSKDINGPYTALDKDTVDGNGYYAGRMETDGEKLYMVGWNATKIDHQDSNEYDWAGNMVVHQLLQHDDGTLTVVVNDSIKELVNNKKPAVPVAMTETIENKGSNYDTNGDKYEFVEFAPLTQSYRIEADVTGFSAGDKFGIAFDPTKEYVGKMNYMFNVDENAVQFYNTSKLLVEDAQSSIDFDFTGKDRIHLTILGSDSVLCLYVDDEIALTARMYGSQSDNWELYSINSDITWENVEIYEQ